MSQIERSKRAVLNGEAIVHTLTRRFTGTLVNLSESGVQVLCREPAGLGDAAQVQLLIDGYQREVSVNGEIRRVLPDRIGIQFECSEAWKSEWGLLNDLCAPEPRILERFPAEGEAALLAQSGWITCKLRNVSKKGLQVQVDAEVELNDSVEVMFHVVGQPAPITVHGDVASNRSGRIGINFGQASTWDSMWRKKVAFDTVKQDKLVALLTPAELMERIAAIRQEGAGESNVAAKTKSLWKMESLGVTFGRAATAGDSLADARLPAEACPIAHVGMGGAAVEVSNFDAAKITQLIDSLARPAYRLFGYEQIGAMLGVYEKSVPRLMLGLKALNRPEDAPFIASFPSEVQRLISHGFGRLLYFNSKHIDDALRNIKARTFLDPAAAVQGMAFGYAMVNHEDLATVLGTGGSLMDAKLIAAFQSGLIYALMFWEWCWPGLLNTLPVPHAQAGKLLAAAQREIASARQAGALPPFKVSAGIAS